MEAWQGGGSTHLRHRASAHLGGHFALKSIWFTSPGATQVQMQGQIDRGASLFLSSFLPRTFIGKEPIALPVQGNKQSSRRGWGGYLALARGLAKEIQALDLSPLVQSATLSQSVHRTKSRHGFCDHLTQTPPGSDILNTASFSGFRAGACAD